METKMKQPIKGLGDTLLGKFASEKIRCYVVPKKKGIPKGQRIGFSFQKYLASLLVLSSTPLKEIAKDFVSYDLLRQWVIDTDFRNLVEEHIKEFSALWIDEVLQEDRSMKGQPKEHELVFNFMNRLHEEGVHYHLQTWVGLVRELKARVEIDPCLMPYLMFALRFKATLMERNMKGQRDKDRLLKEMEWIEKEAGLNDLERTIEILRKPEIPKSEKEFLLWRFETEAKLVREDFERIEKELKETP
jgi:hypothetical protein